MMRYRGTTALLAALLVGLTYFLYPRISQLRSLGRDPRLASDRRAELAPWLKELPPSPPASPRNTPVRAPDSEPSLPPRRATLLESAEADYAAGRAAGSRESLRALLAQASLAPDELFRGVQLAQWMREYALAAAYSDAFLGSAPFPPPLDRLGFMAQVYADAGKHAKAADLWVSVYWTAQDEALQKAALDAVLALEPIRRGIELCRDFVNQHPGDPESRIRLAKLYQAKGEVEAFARELGTLPPGDPAREEGQAQLLALYIARRDYERLRPSLERLVREGKAGPEGDRLYLEMLDETGQSEELAAVIEDRLRQRPEDADLLRRMAALKESRLRPGEAADCWARLFELGHDERDLGVKAAAVYELEGRWEAARRLYRMLEARLPGEEQWGEKLSELHDPQHEREVAIRARDEKDERRALAAASHRLSHDPRDPAMLRLAGEIEFGRGNLTAARDSYRRLVEQDGSDSHDSFMLSECLAALGEKPRALAVAQKSLDVLPRVPDSPAQKFLSTRLVMRLGYSREARQRLEELLLEDPDNLEILGTYAWLLLERKETRELDRVLDHWRALEPGSDELHLISGLRLRRLGRLEEAARELKPDAGTPAGAARVAEYADTLLELGRWVEARSVLQEQEREDPRFTRIRERIDATYGPESSASFSNFEAAQAEIWRARETYKAFLDQNFWIAELVGYGSFRGRVAALGQNERDDLLEGTVELGYWPSPALHFLASAGAWEEGSLSQATGSLASDFKSGGWTVSIDLEANRPWDTLVETVAFEGRENRVQGQGEWASEAVHLNGSLRYSRFEVEDERQVLTSHFFGAEIALLGRVEARLWSKDAPAVGAEFWDETLRFERGKSSSFSLVYQFTFDEFLGDLAGLAAIPLVRRSTAHLVGVSGAWAQSDRFWVSGEFLVGADPARSLSPGELYTGSFKCIYVVAHRVLIEASVDYVSEQLKVGGGGSWVTQLSLNLNF